MARNGKILLLLFPLTLFSCHYPESEQDQRTVFRYNEPSGLKTLDPAFARDQAHTWVSNLLYNRLVKLDDDLKISPSIAKSWEISEDGLEYTFLLRNDVYFHEDESFDTRKVLAGDVVYSLTRLVDPDVASPGAWVLQKVARTGKNRPAIAAPNDSTVQIRLTEPYPPFLGILAMQYCSVVNMEAVEYYGPGFRKNPVGTGPFRFKMWVEGLKLVLVKNNNYFEKEGNFTLPYLDAVSVRFLADKQAAFLEFIKGNLDFISGIDPAYKDEILTPDGKLNPDYSDRIRMVTEPYLNTEYLGFLMDDGNNVDGNPLLLWEVRKAINLGFDRQKMMKYLRNSIGTPGEYGIIPAGMPAFNGAGKANWYAPDSAAALLTTAGFPGGRGLGPVTLHSTSDHLDISKFIQHQLGEIGIQIEIEVHPPATLRDLKADAKLPFFRASWIADYPDEENYLSLFFSENHTPAGPNFTHFSNPAYDSLYIASQKEFNDSLRLKQYREMDRIIADECPVVVLYYDQVLRFTGKDVLNLGSNPMNLLDLGRVKKKSVPDNNL